MTEDKNTPGPVWLAFLAGAIVLGTGPMALAFLLLLAARGEAGAAGGLAALVNEGGPFSYAVLFAGALASLFGAVFAGLSVRRASLPAPLALLPFLLPVLAAAVGAFFGMRDLVSAIVNVNPADKATILMAGTGELWSLPIQGLAFAASGVLAVSLAAMVALTAPGRGRRVLTMLGAGTLGLSLAAATVQTFTLHSGFSALTRVSPADRLTLLAGMVEEWQQLGRVSNWLFVASLVVAAVGAALLSTGAQRAAGFATAAVLLVAAVGFRGFDALARRQFLSANVVASPAPLMTVKGREPSSFSFVDLTDDDPRHIDAAVLARARRVEGESAWLAVPLRPELKAVSVLRALQTAHFVSVNVELVGDAPRRHLDAPPLFSTAIAAVSHVRLAAPVGVLFPDQDCERCDGVAKLTDAGLEVGGKTWALEEVALGGEIETLARVELAWPGTTEALVRAALIALSHQHVLVVRVAPPSPPPVLPDY